MSDCEDTDNSCGEEQVVPEWEVRKEWLENILSKYHEEKVQVREFEVSPGCRTNESILSDIIRVKGKYIQCKDHARLKLAVIIKRLPKDPFSRYFVTEGQFHLREIKFYTEIVPDLTKFQQKHLTHQKEDVLLKVPMCYYAHYSPEGGTYDSPVPPESILVLRDMEDANYKSVKFSKGLTLEQTKVALKSIASIHAHSLAMKVIDGIPLSERYPFLFQTSNATNSYQQLIERSLPQLADFLRNKPGLEVVLKTLMVLRPKTKDIISTLLSPEEPLALITHMDFWCNNLLFSNIETDACYIIDWQMITYSRPTNDIALLLVSSVPTELRRKHTEIFLDTYWSSLTLTCSYLGLDIPKDLGYTREDLNKDYRRSQLLALLLCIGSMDVALGNPSTEQRLIDILQDLHNDGVLTDESILE